MDAARAPRGLDGGLRCHGRRSGNALYDDVPTTEILDGGPKPKC